jgi:uncharacterized protein (TIGR02996 family)
VESERHPHLKGLSAQRVMALAPPGAGQPLDGGDRLEPLESLYALKDFAWAVYLHDGAWRLHVASGLEVALNGVATGGGALATGDVIDAEQTWRFVMADWPGVVDEAFDRRVLATPDDVSLALVYRDWLLEHESPRAEALRRPVPHAEQARHLWPFAKDIAQGFLEARFAGPYVRKLVTRRPSLDLVDFATDLARAAAEHPHLTVVQTLGLSADDGAQLALLLARTDGLERLERLESGARGAFRLEDFRARDREPEGHRDVRALSSPREGPARPLTVDLLSWDGWTSVEPLTSTRRFGLEVDTALVLHDDGAALVPEADGLVRWRRADDWILEVSERTPDAMTPRLHGRPMRGAFGVGPGDVLELVPGLVCRLGPA